MQELPSGTLTLLFSDIEGSTSRWEEDAARMRSALRAHDAILNDTVPAFGGRVVKHTGDGVAAAFVTATAAAQAAIEIQRRLQRDPWDSGDRLKVRIGLHTGDLSPTEGDYFGPVPNRAARVMNLANGNQIACTAATAALLGGITTQSKGQHELRGIGPEELFLISSEDIETDDRPLRLPVEPSNLPSISTSFVGREADIAAITDYVRAGAGLVSILGPGGVGKTRLAIEVGGKLRSDFGGGVHFCDLAPLAEPEAVAQSVAEVIGARRQPGLGMEDSIADYLERAETLVILDNCEHLMEPVRALVERLATVDTTTVLTTTREAIAVPGEQLVVLAPLEPDDAGVQLFVERALERDPAFSVDARNRESVRDVVRHLDGIPLAIELAAAWVRVLGPAELVERLDDRFRLLRGGRRGDRHRTLEDTVRWSYDLLTPPEAALFSRLSVFAGGFTLAAVEQVCVDVDGSGGEAAAAGSTAGLHHRIDEHDIPDLLMALVDKSMIVSSTRSDETRFGMLETLRGFAQRALDESGDSDAYRRRHAHWCLEMAQAQNERLFSPAEAQAWIRLDREWDNLRLALDTFEDVGDPDRGAGLIESLVWFAIYSMRFELFTWASELLDVDGFDDNEHFTNICGAAAMGHYFAVADRAIDLAERGLAANPKDPMGLCRTALAAVYLNNVHTADASAALTSQWLQAEPDGVANRLWAHGFRTFHLCTYEPESEGAAEAEATMAIARETGSPSTLAVAYWAEGQAVAIHDREAAYEIWKSGLEWARSLPSNHLLEHLLVGLLIHFQVRRGELAEVLRLCETTVRSALRQHYLAGASHLLGVSAIALARAGDADTGAQLLGAMVANGHNPRRNAIAALSAEFGAELESKMAPGRALSVNQAAKMALAALAAAQERVATDAVAAG